MYYTHGTSAFSSPKFSFYWHAFDCNQDLTLSLRASALHYYPRPPPTPDRFMQLTLYGSHIYLYFWFRVYTFSLQIQCIFNRNIFGMKACMLKNTVQTHALSHPTVTV